MPIVFFVIRNLSIACILGINFVQDSHAILDCSAKVLSLYDVAPLICNFDRDSILLLSRSIILPPRSEMFVPVNLHRKFIGQTLLVEGWPALKNRMIAVAAALIEPQTNKSLCRVVNADDTPKRLRVNSPVATVSYLPIDVPNNAHLLPATNLNHSPLCMTITEETLPSHEDRVKVLEELGISFSDTVLLGEDMAKLSSLLTYWV